MSKFIERTDPEFNRAWIALADRGEDIDAQNHGETWQYMGSEQHTGHGWYHCFRHRSHPRDGQRIYVTVPASAAWSSAKEARL